MKIHKMEVIVFVPLCIFTGRSAVFALMDLGTFLLKR